MPVPAHPHHTHLTLANGLRVSLRHAPRLKRCAAVLRVTVGSHDVPLAWPGLAHFLEHLLFLATERFPANEGLMAYVQRHGGQVNASTRERTTDFFFEVPIAAFAGALDRLGDMLAHPRLAVDDQLREREVLQAEFVAWSQDVGAQQQLALLEGLAADHPLRAFHAGNRDSLPVERGAFQQALRDFYEQFYQTGQMSLSIAGPQSLEELNTLAQQFDAGQRPGVLQPQVAPPALINNNAPTYQHADREHLHQVLTGDAPREALDFLCTWLNASAPGGLLAELKSRELATGLKATVLYQFKDQAVVDIAFASGNNPTLIEELLHDWLSFFAHSDWKQLRDEYTLLIARQQRINGALALARRDSEGMEPALSEHHDAALKALLDTLQLQPARHTWQLPPNNPFLSPPAKEERPGLIRGQTSAHRGLRTFAQDRSRGRKDVSPLTFSQALPDDSDEGALYLQWRVDSPVHPDLFPCLDDSLRENARQAGVELSFEAVGNDWLLKMTGLHEPMPAVLEHVVRNLTQPVSELSSRPAQMIAIRELLKALPFCLAGVSQPDSAAGAPWSTAQWQGFAVGLPGACEAAIKRVAARLPGQPARPATSVRAINGQHLWHRATTESSEAALLLFCPTPSQSLADEASWRVLAHLAQAPFYQRLRVELQVGYAVFSGIRQYNGQTGLLFGVQSPSVSLAGIVDHLQTFLEQLPALIDSNADLGDLAQQFSPQALPTAQAVELLWHAHLAGHSSDYLTQIQPLIQSRTRQDLLHAAQQLRSAAGGWCCLANGPHLNDSWQAAD